MNKIKNFFKTIWNRIKELFTTENEYKDPDCHDENCYDENSVIHCGYRIITEDDPIVPADTEHACECKEGCKCDCDCHEKNKDEEVQTEEHYEQLTFDIFVEENGDVIKFYDDDTITRAVLIAELRNAGITGISRMKRTELLAKFHEMNLKFPEMK